MIKMNINLIENNYIYCLIKDYDIVYGGQSNNPERRIEEHKADKDFNLYKIIDFPLNANEANIVEMDVIQRYGLMNNGLNKSLTHYTKWSNHKEEYLPTLRLFYKAIESDGLLCHMNGYKSFDGNFIDYWQNEYNKFQESDLSLPAWCCFQGKYCQETFIKNTKQFNTINSKKYNKKYNNNNDKKSKFSIEDWDFFHMDL